MTDLIPVAPQPLTRGQLVRICFALVAASLVVQAAMLTPLTITLSLRFTEIDPVQAVGAVTLMSVSSALVVLVSGPLSDRTGPTRPAVLVATLWVLLDPRHRARRGRPGGRAAPAEPATRPASAASRPP